MRTRPARGCTGPPGVVVVAVPPAPRTGTTLQDDRYASRFAAALCEGDIEQATALLVLLHAQGAPLGAVIDQVLLPLLAREDERSTARQTTFVSVHSLSLSASAVLARLLPPRRRPPRGTVVLASPPGERHQLGLQALAVALQEAGWAAHVVGDGPLAQLSTWCAALAVPPTVVGLSLSQVPDADDVRAGVTALREAVPGVFVVMGGAAVSADPTLGPRLGADGVADSCTGAVDLVQRLTRPLDEPQVAVLQLVASGCTNDQIARALGLSPSRSKAVVERVLAVLQVPDRAAAAAEGVRRGWL